MSPSQMERTFGGPVIVGRARRAAAVGWFRRNREKYLWCSVCSRTFPNGTYRLVDGQQRCPYADCDADVAQDASGWSLITREHPNYPAVPWLGIQYPYKPPAPVMSGSYSRSAPGGKSRPKPAPE